MASQYPAVPLADMPVDGRSYTFVTFVPPDLRRDPTYVVDSPLWTRWFEAEHDAHRQSIKAHLEGLDDGDIDYEAHDEYQVSRTPP
jgi:hypothetical protein